MAENTDRNKSLQYSKNDVLSVSGEYGIVNQIALQGRSFAGVSVADYHVVETNDVVYTKSPLKANPYGIIKHNSGVPGIVSTLYAVYHPKSCAISQFIDYYFQNDLRLNKYLKPLVNIGAKHDMKINNEVALTGDVIFPSVDEQAKIVDFLKLIDEKIAKQKQLVEALKSYKRGALSKLFPQKGASLPEYRFAGFCGDWEQRKLGEIVDVRSGRDYKHLSEGSIPVYGTGGYMLSVNEALSYDEDAIGIGRKGTIDKPYVLKAPFWTVDTLFYAVPSKNVDLDFAFCIFQNVDWKKKDESTGVPSLSKTAINSIDVITPPFKEQQKIGSFFRSLDDLVTLQQQEVSIAQKIKSGLLNGLFI